MLGLEALEDRRERDIKGRILWNGGRRKHNLGYKFRYVPEHYFAIKKYVLEHRLVWEEEYNAILLPWADVHHKDDNPANNVWYNLTAMMHGQHMSLTHKGNRYSKPKRRDFGKRKCDYCGTLIVRMKEGYETWFRHKEKDNSWLCEKHYYKLFPRK